VGDEGFQRKCLNRVKQFQQEGRTIVFVTHAPDLVRQICDAAVMLLKGRLHAQGQPGDVVREFRLQMLKHDLAYATDEGSKEIEIVSAELIRDNGQPGTTLQPGEALTIQMDLKANQPVDDPVVSFAVHDQGNQFVFGTNTDWRGVFFPRFEGKKRLRWRIRSIPFVQGRYWVTLGVHSRDSARVYHVQEQRYSLEVRMGEERPGQVFLPVDVEVEDL
jgi:ABC-2 type transport system ATP-binding protein